MMIDGAFRFLTALNLDTSLVSDQNKCVSRVYNFHDLLKNFINLLFKKSRFFTANIVFLINLKRFNRHDLDENCFYDISFENCVGRMHDLKITIHDTRNKRINERLDTRASETYARGNKCSECLSCRHSRKLQTHLL